MIGSSAYGSPVTDADTAVQPLKRTGSVLVSASTKAEYDAGVAGDSAGDTIQFKIILVNTGTTTLSSMSVSSAQLLEQFERYDTSNTTFLLGKYRERKVQ